MPSLKRAVSAGRYRLNTLMGSLRRKRAEKGKIAGQAKVAKERRKGISFLKKRRINLWAENALKHGKTVGVCCVCGAIKYADDVFYNTGRTRADWHAIGKKYPGSKLSDGYCKRDFDAAMGEIETENRKRKLPS